MTGTYARFATTPIGPSLRAADAGLSLTHDGAVDFAQFGIGDISVSGGTAGCEVFVWGDMSVGQPLPAALGVVAMGSDTGQSMASQGMEWRLGAGELRVGGALVRADLVALRNGDIAGVAIAKQGATWAVSLFRNSQLVAVQSVAIPGPVVFAVALNSDIDGAIHAVINSGQWQGISDAVNGGGWTAARAEIKPVHLAGEYYMSATTDSPANTHYAGVISDEGLDTTAAISFWPWDSTSKAGAGILRLQDGGLLDSLALTEVRDAPVNVRLGTQGSPLADAVAVGRFVLERIDIEDDGRKNAILRDPHDDLDGALHRAVFLPSVSEQLAWQPQPVVIGAVRSVPTIAVNSDGSVQWIGDAAVASVARVLDRGAEITNGDGYSLVAGGQQLAFDDQPVGPIVVDLSSTGPNMQPATLEQSLREVFRRVRKSAWSSEDAAKIDTATGYAGIGYYAREGATARQALDEILPSYSADWWPDGDGVLRIARLIDPDAVAELDLAFQLDWRELAGDLIVKPDLAPGLSRRMAYQPNAVQLASGDMITDVEQLPPAMRQQLSGQYRGQVYSAAPLAPRYNRAEAAAPVVSRFDRREDAQAELDRVIAIYAKPRNFYIGRVSARPELAFRPGQVGRIFYPRYGLDSGRNVLVTSVIANPVTGRHSIRFWGA